MSSSDESQMFSLSALTRNAPASTHRVEPDDDSGVIDLARLSAGFEQSTALPSPEPPLYLPQPLAIPAQAAPSRRRPWRALSVAGGLVVAALAVAFWLTDEPPPALPAAELVPAQPIETSDFARGALSRAPTPTTPQTSSVAEPEPEEHKALAKGAPAIDERKPKAAPHSIHDAARKSASPKPKSTRARPVAKAASTPPSDPCAHCAQSDLKCHMRCRVR